MASDKITKLEAELEAAKSGEATQKARNKSLKAQMDEVTQEGLELALMLGTAFGASAMMERYAKEGETVNGVTEWIAPDVLGVPIDAVGGGVLLIASIADVGGDKTASIIGAIGEGALASFAAREGAKMGRKSREKRLAEKAGTRKAVGALPPGPGAPGSVGAYGPAQFQQFVNASGGAVASAA